MNEPTDPQAPGSGDAESIYQAPQSETAAAPKGDLMAAFLGPKNADYYSRHFDRFKGEGSSVSWNWPAFFFTFPWLLYRKMWGLAAAYFFLLPLALFLLMLMLMVIVDPVTAGGIYNVIWAGTVLAVIPMYANWLYFRHAENKIRKVTTAMPPGEAQSLQIARIGGTSNVVIIILPIIVVFFGGIIAAIAIPAYQDYTIRAQISEGLNLSAGAKVAVTEYYQDTSEFPRNNESAGVMKPDSISGKYVASVAIQDGEIIVTYGNDSHAVINGETLLLSPSADSGSVSWSCFSQTISDKHLPAACR